MQKEKTGKLGENIANNYLLGKGYLILSRNQKEGFDEIDIIAKDPGGILIFCEVKTINNKSGYGSSFMPEDNLSSRKLRKLVRGARMFLARHPRAMFDKAGWQIDLMAIILREGNTAEIRHYKNI